LPPNRAESGPPFADRWACQRQRFGPFGHELRLNAQRATKPRDFGSTVDLQRLERRSCRANPSDLRPAAPHSERRSQENTICSLRTEPLQLRRIIGGRRHPKPECGGTVHQLAIALIPFDADRERARRRSARYDVIEARLDTLLFRFEEPDDLAWGVGDASGFRFDWWEIGGRWHGWGRKVRKLLRNRQIRLLGTPIPLPRGVASNAVWTEDLGRAPFTASSEYPTAVITPYSEWIDCPSALPIFGTPTARQRKARAAWFRRLRRLARTYTGCLAIAVDYHC
jgi:hypothetical protein